MEGVTIATLLASVGAVVSQCMEWVVDISEAIVSNPLLMLGVVGVPLVGLGIGVLKRLLSARV